MGRGCRAPQEGTCSQGDQIRDQAADCARSAPRRLRGGEVGVGLFDVDGLGVAVPCQWCGKPVVFIEQPGISGLGREQDKLTDRDDSSVVSGGAALNIAYLIGETKVLAVNHALAWC